MFGCWCIYKLLVTQGKNIYQLYKCSIYWLQSYKVSVPESDKEKNDCDIKSCSNGANLNSSLQMLVINFSNLGPLAASKPNGETNLADIVKWQLIVDNILELYPIMFQTICCNGWLWWDKKQVIQIKLWPKCCLISKA